MRSVFKLSDREAGVAFNHPRTHVFVVQVFETPDSHEEMLRTRYQQARYTDLDQLLLQYLRRPDVDPDRGYISISETETIQLYRDVLAQIERDLDFQWRPGQEALLDDFSGDST
jgi:hypothetical protein